MKATKKGKGKKGSLNALEEMQATTAVTKPGKETKVQEDEEVVEEYWVDTVEREAMMFGMDKNGAKRKKVGTRNGKDQNGQAVLTASSQKMEKAEELMLQGFIVGRISTARFKPMEVPIIKMMNLQVYYL